MLRCYEIIMGCRFFRVRETLCLVSLVVLFGMTMRQLFTLSNNTVGVAPNDLTTAFVISGVNRTGHKASSAAIASSMNNNHNNNLSADIPCQESPAYPLHETNFSMSRNVSKFMTIKRLTNNSDDTSTQTLPPAAICRFRHDLPFSHHFPHTMLQLYRCFAYWRHYANMTPVLEWKHDKLPLHKNHFLAGFTRILNESSLKVQFVSSSAAEELLPKAPLFGNNSITAEATLNDGGLYEYAMASAEDAVALREAASTVLGLPTAISANSTACQVQPRIALLNRNKTRQLLNIEALKEMLDPMGSVKVGYFERQPLSDQILFMMDSDILVSPHGAQLTSLPFLPPCAVVLEIFPTGYYAPYFFGQLAAISGVRHAYIYLGRNRTEEVAVGSATLVARKRTRSLNVCPPLGHLRDAVQHLITLWKQCCLRRNGPT